MGYEINEHHSPWNSTSAFSVGTEVMPVLFQKWEKIKHDVKDLKFFSDLIFAEKLISHNVKTAERTDKESLIKEADIEGKLYLDYSIGV